MNAEAYTTHIVTSLVDRKTHGLQLNEVAIVMTMHYRNVKRNATTLKV